MTAWHMAPELPRRSRLAAASLVFAFLVPPLAPLLGIAALVRIEAARGRLTGRGLALAGTLLGLAIVAAAVALGVAFREPLESRLAPLAGKAAPPPARGSAPGSIRKISEAQSKFREKTGSFGSLEELWRSGLLDRADPGDGAYKFDVFLAPSRKKYSVTAVPRGAEKLYYLLDEEGKLRFEEGRPAVAPGSPLWEDAGGKKG
jgi:hypothetical protein